MATNYRVRVPKTSNYALTIFGGSENRTVRPSKMRHNSTETVMANKIVGKHATTTTGNVTVPNVENNHVHPNHTAI